VVEGEGFFDYCLWPYEPLAEPRGRFRSSNLLFHSFAVAGAHGLYDVCDAIRCEIGEGRTVWGIKFDGTSLIWEFYFYDYGRLERTVSLPRLLRALAPYANSDLPSCERRPYFMFSLDLDAAFGDGAPIDEANLYMGNTGCSVSSGLSYRLSAEGLEFDNLYYFYAAGVEDEQILQKTLCSAHLDLAEVRVEEILWPEMRPLEADRGCVVVANKRHNDGVYFSRIRLPQLDCFLRRLNYPTAIVDYIEAHAAELDHLLFDVGIDYQMRDGRVEILKSGYYGLF